MQNYETYLTTQNEKREMWNPGKQKHINSNPIPPSGGAGGQLPIWDRMGAILMMKKMPTLEDACCKRRRW